MIGFTKCCYRTHQSLYNTSCAAQSLPVVCAQIKLWYTTAYSTLHAGKFNKQFVAQVRPTSLSTSWDFKEISVGQQTPPPHSTLPCISNHLFLGDVVCVLWLHRPVWVVIHKLLAPVFGLPNDNTRSSLCNTNSTLKTVNNFVWLKHCLLDIHRVWYCTLSVSHTAN